MIHYIKKAIIRRNLDDLCEFMHNEIDSSDLEVDKVFITKLTDENHYLTYNYSINSRFVKNSHNNPDKFGSFRDKINEILENSPLTISVTHDKRTSHLVLKVLVKHDWLEQKDVINSLESRKGIVKFNL